MEFRGQGPVTELANVLVRREPPEARITLNRPDRRNALSLELMEEVTAVLRELGEDAEVRAIVVEGAGPGFSGGHDLAEMAGRDAAFYQRLFGVCTEMMEAIHRVPQPVIARVHGIATAAGCQLVATCDLAVASEEARFGTSGVKTGLFCSTPGVAVARSVGRKQALEMLLTGELVDAQTALRWGLVNRVVPAGELDAAVAEFVDAVARLSPLAIALGKRAFYGQVELDEHGAYDLTKEVMATNALAEDAQEGMCAFLEKRPATWKGR
jgi:enoyl-CoA hydratase/carnithine racemase